MSASILARNMANRLDRAWVIAVNHSPDRVQWNGAKQLRTVDF